MSKVMARANGLDVHEVPDGYIVYQNEHDNVCYLNKTAAIVFEFCDGNLDSDEIIARVAKIFELKNSSDSEIRECLDSLVKEGLVRFNSK
jgi:Coenzyme PQQ synthesis protein D (PqqD)